MHLEKTSTFPSQFSFFHIKYVILFQISLVTEAAEYCGCFNLKSSHERGTEKQPHAASVKPLNLPVAENCCISNGFLSTALLFPRSFNQQSRVWTLLLPDLTLCCIIQHHCNTNTEHREHCSVCTLELQHLPRVTNHLELHWTGCELTEPTINSPKKPKRETTIFNSFENSWRASRPLWQFLSRLKTLIFSETVRVMLCSLVFQFFIFEIWGK